MTPIAYSSVVTFHAIAIPAKFVLLILLAAFVIVALIAATIVLILYLTKQRSKK